MSEAPLPLMLRRADALAMIAPYGVTESEFKTMVECGVIDRITLHEGGRGYYITAQLRRIIIDPVEAALRQAEPPSVSASSVPSVVKSSPHIQR